MIILIIICLAFFFSCLLLGLSYSLNYQDNNFVKLSSYECGFLPFDDSRGSFNIEFYLVSILFVIFDLEIVFLFPLCLCLNLVGFLGIYSALLFLGVLILGFVYEWIKGGLEW